MAQPYHFTTNWQLAAPVSEVYALIHNAEAWPLWWPSVRSVLAYTDQDGAERQQQHWRTPFGYAFSFDLKLIDRQPDLLLKAVATGMLEGTGTWRFQETQGGCLVSFEWNVKTGVPWMKKMDWLLRPVFTYNHRLVMEQGRQGIEKLLTLK